MLLVVAVVLGFGLSIVSQSTTDVKITEHDQEATRAFNAAEAGIEAAMKNISTIGSFSKTVDNILVNYQVTPNTFLEGLLSENESAQVVLGGVNTWLNIEWVNRTTENPGCNIAESGGAPASLLITIVNNSNVLRRVAVNACASFDGVNGMTSVGVDDSGNEYLKKYRIQILTTDVYARIRPIYNQASIRVYGTPNDLPTQSYNINSKAISTTIDTNPLESKAIEVTKTQPATPSIFDYVLFSGLSIIKY